MDRRVTVVYLAGFGRSGSTLVERALGACPGWANVGELVDLARSVAPRDERCGCGAAFSTCPVWAQVGQRAFGGWHAGRLTAIADLQRQTARQRHLPGMLARARARRPARGIVRDLAAAYAAVIRAFAEVTESRVVVDASKGPAFGMALAASPSLDVRFLHVVRDPRAVAWSWMQRVERPHAPGRHDEMWRIRVGRSAAQWTGLQLEAEAVRRLSGLPNARLRYEDLLQDPALALIRAGAELGLPLAPGDLSHVQGHRLHLDPSHGLSGNPSRFEVGQVDLRADERWRSAMPPRDRAVATALSVPLLAAYGYPVATRPTRPSTRRNP
jgi:hypothetical protein